MCDPGVLWYQPSLSPSLDIVAYYSPVNVTVPSWFNCLQDDAAEFVRRNYSLTPAGERRSAFKVSS